MALVPAVLLVALAMGQAAVAGYASWSATAVARVGARAQAIGEDPKRAVRRELPAFLRQDARVRVAHPDGDHPDRVLVTLRVPSLLGGLDLGDVRGRAALPSQGPA